MDYPSIFRSPGYDYPPQMPGPSIPGEPIIPVETTLKIKEAFKQVEVRAITPVPALKILEDGAQAMRQRAELRDSPHGERSMRRIVMTFNALTGHELTAAEGWEFMVILKMVRGRQGFFNEDDYADMASYSALLGEEESSVAKRIKS